MECVRCHKSMTTDIAELNAYHYGANWYACVHCGKLYKIYRPETVVVEPVEYGILEEDDWGSPVVSDYDYYTELAGEDSLDSFENI